MRLRPSSVKPSAASVPPQVEKSRSLPLCSFREAALWQRDNPFICGHYRTNYSTSMALRSLFTIHNETGNIWTHLFGLLVMCALSAYVPTALLSPHAMHYFVYMVFASGTILCMGCSTMFHLLECHVNKKVFDWMQTLDYFGITTHVVGSFIPPIYFVFYCFPWLQLMYLGMVAAVGSVGIFGPFFEFFHAEGFRWKRLGVYVVMIGSGVIPLVHVQFILPLNHVTIPFSVNVAVMFLMYAIGCVFFVSKFPERAFPGKFDLLFHSHQLWHVFVLAATIIHFFTCMALYQRYKLSGPVC